MRWGGNKLIVHLVGKLSYYSLSIDLETASLNVHAPPPKVTFDFARMGFAEPSGIVMLHNLTRYLAYQGVAVFYQNFTVASSGLQFLDGAGFFENVLGKKAFPFTRLKNTTLSLREVRSMDARGWVDTTFLPWFSNCSHRPLPALGHFGTCIVEIFNNIKDHSAYEVGSIFAQWYPNIDELKLAIGDFGRGIPANVATVEPHLNKPAAIQRAFDEGFSTHSTPKNRGAGLDFLLQNVCGNLQGNMTVYSGGAAVYAAAGGQTTPLQLSLGNSGYTGTLFEIRLPTRYIQTSTPHEEELIW